MDERKDGAEWQGNPNRPVEDERLVRFGRYRPHGGSEDEQDDETRPFESATRAGMHVRLFVAGGTKPAFVEAEWKKRNPENVVGVEGANLHGAARLGAGEAVVVAKGDPLGAEAVHAVNDEQGHGRGRGL